MMNERIAGHGRVRGRTGQQIQAVVQVNCTVEIVKLMEEKPVMIEQMEISLMDVMILV